MEKKNLSNLRLIFMGTSSFAATILEALQKENAQIISVYTQTEKPVGRKQVMEKSAVAQVAEKYQLPVWAPRKLDEEILQSIKNLAPEIIVVAAYGKILPEALLSIPTLGALNVHGSLLPKYRGASPIQSALLNNEKETGITLIKMDKGIDTGDIIMQAALLIEPEETAQALEKRLADLGADTLITALPRWANGELLSCPQNSAGASYCSLLTREHGQINWHQEAQAIFCQYRACAGWPEIFTTWEGKRLKLKRITLKNYNSDPPILPGTVFASGNSVLVAAKNGAIALEEVQLEGKKAMPIADFIRGYKNFVGSQLK